MSLIENSNQQEDTMRDKYLSFSLVDEYYGIDIKYVTEIVGVQPITIVPDLPNFIKGIINLRGRIIPVMDIRLKFKKKEIEYNDRTCIIVIDIDDFSIGLIVDEVSEVVSIESNHIVAPPDLGGVSKKYIKSIGKHKEIVILIIDCHKLISREMSNNFVTKIE